MRMHFAIMAAILVATPAQADRAAAERCATALQPMGQQLFMRALPGVLGGSSVADALRSAAASLVVSGVLNRDTGRQAAEAAGGCLALARPP